MLHNAVERAASVANNEESSMPDLNVVTGATGHVGNVLVRHLLERNRRVRALVQPREDVSPLADLPVELAWADVTQPDTLDQALEGADVVFHVAGLVSITRGQRERLWQVNVEGTRNVVETCRRQHVRRLVYVSSGHALAEPPTPPPPNSVISTGVAASLTLAERVERSKPVPFFSAEARLTVEVP